MCNVDNSALAIYRDEKRDGKSPWKRIATLTLPDDAPYKFISSPETIASAKGVGGVSYFSLLARENKDRNSRGSIWVLGLGTDEKNRFVRRVDDGASSTVLEPEPFVGKNEVYVYYNAYNAAHAGKRPAPRRHGHQGGPHHPAVTASNTRTNDANDDQNDWPRSLVVLPDSLCEEIATTRLRSDRDFDGRRGILFPAHGHKWRRQVEPRGGRTVIRQLKSGFDYVR